MISGLGSDSQEYMGEDKHRQFQCCSPNGVFFKKLIKIADDVCNPRPGTSPCHMSEQSQESWSLRFCVRFMKL